MSKPRLTNVQMLERAVNKLTNQLEVGKADPNSITSLRASIHTDRKTYQRTAHATLVVRTQLSAHVEEEEEEKGKGFNTFARES